MAHGRKGPAAHGLPRFHPARILSGVALVAFVGGCALLGRGEDDDVFAPRDRDEPVTLEIRNDNFNDARIYVHWDGHRSRVGMVVGKTSQSFELRWRADDLRVEVDFMAAGDFITERMPVWPGETVYLWIPPSP